MMVRVEAKNSVKYSGIIWNAIGGILSAGQSAIVLIFVSYRLGLTIAGMVTIAYAIAILLMSICKYGVRNFQVTDTNEEFCFSDYFYNRCFTTLLSCALLGLYLLYQFFVADYSWVKGIILIEVTMLKLIDAFEDVYVGRFQQVGHLETGAKIMTLRLFFSTMIICLLTVVGNEIYVALLGGIIASLGMDVFLFINSSDIADIRLGKLKVEKLKKLIQVCFPLCVGMTLSIYIGNVPKYMLDIYVHNEKLQAIFGYIMMPVFVIMLLNQFIYQPMIKDLGDLWSNGDKKQFKKNVIRQCFIVAGLAGFVIIAGLLLGLPLLSLLYNTDLSMYQTEFTVLLAGGAFFALASYLNVPITIIRKQKYIAYGYLSATVLAIALGRFLVLTMSMMGAALLYFIVNFYLAIMYTVIMVLCYK